MTTRSRTTRHFDNVQVRVEHSDKLPPGIIGRIAAVALPFNEIDSYGTSFAPGCAARSIAQKVAARKVPFLLDHERKTDSHCGTVMLVEDAGSGYLMSSDILDTRVGRDTLEYAKALMASGGTTGVSIGFIPRKSEFKKMGERTIEMFTEIELSEISLTPMPAVPGASVIGARKDATSPAEGDEEGRGEGDGEPVPDTKPPVDGRRDDITILALAARAALDALPPEARANVLKQYTASPTPSVPDSPRASGTPATSAKDSRSEAVVSLEDRIKAVRASYCTLP